MSERDRLDKAYGRRGGHMQSMSGRESRTRKHRRCDRCGGALTVAAAGQTRHAVCNPATLAGKRCTCPPGCTTPKGSVGDGPRPCAPDCEVCTQFAGRPARDMEGWTR